MKLSVILQIAWSEGNTCIAEPNLMVLPLIICFMIASLLPLERDQKEYPWYSFDLQEEPMNITCF